MNWNQLGWWTWQMTLICDRYRCFSSFYAPRCRWTGSVKMYLTEIVSKDDTLLDLFVNIEQTRLLVTWDLNTVHSCSLNELVTAKHTSEQPSSHYLSDQSIYCFGNAFITSVTVDIFDMDRKHLVVHTRFFPSYQIASASPTPTTV